MNPYLILQDLVDSIPGGLNVCSLFFSRIQIREHFLERLVDYIVVEDV